MADAPLLAYTVRLDHPARVWQTLQIYLDGQVWYWATLPGPDRAGDSAGTYRFALAPGELDECRSLADALLALPVPSTTPVFNVIWTTVTAAGSGGASRTHPLSYAAADEMPPLLNQARERGEALMRRGEEAPLAVARLRLRTGRPSMRASERATLHFGFENIGTEPVRFLLRPDRFVVQSAQGSEWQDAWQAPAEGQLGLTSPRGALVDGLILPAELGPGASASAVFLNTLQRRVPGRLDLRGVVEGSISLLYPDAAPADPPDAPFRLVSATVALDVLDDAPGT